MAGTYLRNDQGSTYRRLRLQSKNRIRIGRPDIGFLYDRPKDLIYFIDYLERTVEVRRPPDTSKTPEGKNPLTREQFEQAHSTDQFLGRARIEGFECEGYKIRSPKHKNRFDAQVWYAPALNFLPLRFLSKLSPGGDMLEYLSNIQVGRAPAPGYFQVPEDFKILKNPRK